MVILAYLSPVVSASRSMPLLTFRRSPGFRHREAIGAAREWIGLGIVDREALNYNACYSIIPRLSPSGAATHRRNRHG